MKKFFTMDNGKEKDLHDEDEMEHLSHLTIEDRDKVRDPRFKTARTKLQGKRTGINEKINKELRMRSGAKNLMDVTRDKKLKQKVALELNYVESNLQLLKEELDEVNCSLGIYQNLESTPPMIPLGLKETSPLDFTMAFKDCILEHYSEVPDKYLAQIELVNQTREMIRSPRRTEEGLAEYIRYFNLLNIIDRRFFSQDRNMAIIFTWFDSFTGVPFQQRTIAFEKGSVLFNLAALYTQVATGQDRTTVDGLQRGHTYFSLAAGALKHLKENFENPPSTDMKSEMVDMTYNLVLAQAQECLYLEMAHARKRSQLHPVNLVGEAAWVSECYQRVHGNLTSELIRQKDHIPYTWMSLVEVKSCYYRGLAYHQLGRHFSKLSDKDALTDEALHTVLDSIDRLKSVSRKASVVRRPPHNSLEVKLLAKAALKESLTSMEEAIQAATLSRHLRQLEPFMSMLKAIHDAWLKQLHDLAVQDVLEIVITAPELRGATRSEAKPTIPAFASQAIDDPFRPLGPIQVFSARHYWTPPRPVVVARDPVRGFGFSIRGDSPVFFVGVDRNSPADQAGLAAGDVITGVGGQDAKWLPQERLINLIKLETEDCRSKGQVEQIRLQIVTPLNVDYSSGVARFSGGSISRMSSMLSPASLPNGLMLSDKHATQSVPTKKGSKWRKRLSGSWFIKKKRETPHADARTFEQP